MRGGTGLKKSKKSVRVERGVVFLTADVRPELRSRNMGWEIESPSPEPNHHHLNCQSGPRLALNTKAIMMLLTRSAQALRATARASSSARWINTSAVLRNAKSPNTSPAPVQRTDNQGRDLPAEQLKRHEQAVSSDIVSGAPGKWFAYRVPEQVPHIKLFCDTDQACTPIPQRSSLLELCESSALPRRPTRPARPGQRRGEWTGTSCKALQDGRTL